MNVTKSHLMTLVTVCAVVLSAGCEDRDPASLELARAKVDPLVFDDDYSEDVYFQPFFETHYLAASLDSVFAFNGFAPDGAKSLKMQIPPLGSALGPYSGGVLTSVASRDMADFNALSFYARAEVNINLDVVGFGNDNTGTSLYEAGRAGIPLSPEWTFFVVPIPDSSKLIAERGMFTFAEAAEAQYPQGYDIWFDEIRYAQLDNINVFRATMRSANRQYFVGSTVPVQNTSTVFEVDGAFVRVDHFPNYFDFVSSDPSVVSTEGGEVKVVGEGEAVVTARLRDLDVSGALTLTGNLPPAVAAPSPSLPAENVISMFSDLYQDVPVDSWRADWGGSTANVEDYVVAGSNNKVYSSLNFVGITFESAKINASDMSHFHLDVYAPSGTDFKVKLVSFPPELSTGVETQDLVLDASTTPAFNAGVWSSLEIPLANFELPPSWDWARIGQLVLSTTDAQLVLVDNVYWHR